MMKKELLFLFVVLHLFSCTLEEKKEDCTDVFCTYEYVTLWVTVANSNEEAVALDYFKVTNVDTGNEITLSNPSGNSEKGVYPLVADGVLEQGVEQELMFQGYINHQEVVSASLVVKEDCCHVSVTSGDVNLTTIDLDTNCDQTTLVNEDLYTNAPDDLLTIINATLTEDCLTINFGSSGCDGASWELKLIDSEQVLESYPVQRKLRLSLKNEELCDAYFTKELSFDISNLQIESYDEILLNIDGYNQQIQYNY